jgi:hypothetical protein
MSIIQATVLKVLTLTSGRGTLCCRWELHLEQGRQGGEGRVAGQHRLGQGV